MVALRRTLPVATALVAILATACSSGSGNSGSTSQGRPESPTASASSSPVAPLVGRWEQVHHCQDLVDAVDEAGLEALAAQEVTEYFPNESVQQLAEKPDPCARAEPFSHSHFFTQTGQFGSLDQNLNQVDNGHYTIINAHTFKIGDAPFHYTITGGDTLSLDPVITPAERKKALANPDEFTTASWMMAVAYPGTTWKRVPCEGWC